MLRSRVANRSPIAFLILCLMTAAWCLPTSGNEAEEIKKWEQTFESDILPIVRDKCVECHQGKDADGGFDASKFDSGTQVSKKMDAWEEVGKRVRLTRCKAEAGPLFAACQRRDAGLVSWLRDESSANADRISQCDA